MKEHKLLGPFKGALILLLLLFLGSCQKQKSAVPQVLTVASNDPRLSIERVELLLSGKPFTGMLTNRNSETRNETPYRKGLIHGVVRDYYHDGRLAAEFVYENGKQVGTDRGWWPNGKMKFHSEHRNGKSHGELFAWDERGLLVEYVRYEDGKELGRKVWRRSGEIFQNYVSTDTRSIGLPGAKLCFKITAGLPVPESSARQKKQEIR